MLDGASSAVPALCPEPALLAKAGEERDRLSAN